MSSGYNLAYRKESVLYIFDDSKYLKLKYYEDTYLSFAIGRMKGKKVFVSSAVVATSNRRLENESLKKRIYLWVKTMLQYVLKREFPNWTYKTRYSNYR